MDAPEITVSLHIVNSYQRYPTEITTFTDVTVGACPIDHLPESDEDWQLLDGWLYDHIYPFTGVGHTDGDSWYDVTITASSLPWLVNVTFSWGD